ncbi:transcriptional regulator [Sediminicola sp. YIK13]|uniref:response regulator n=1 Tax=Sediminicola sp. YIK13 TaxID=1453352 RepID=UPI000720FF30|nr:response regulator [Sediminicola sp. YIK13]ALM09059.1 transcriptional regulator [Sediminicola sp. YIK13]
MDVIKYNLLLADDDSDDCLFFKEALEELPVDASLSIVNDGVQLMDFLSSISGDLPDALFLDLNMPRKSGLECLTEIKVTEELKQLPIIIFSTSLDLDVVDSLYEKGATFYIRKPGDFSALKKVIFEAITLTNNTNSKHLSREEFILLP